MTDRKAAVIEHSEWCDSYPAGLVSSRLSKVGDVNSLYSTKYTGACPERSRRDPNGNITSDLAPNITRISYDWRNHPVEMAAGSRTYTYRYEAGGLRSYRKVVTGAGAPREEYFVGGMVLSPSGALLRLDISEGFAEIAQNGTMKRSVALKDWLGTARVTLDGGGAVAQAADYDPYGRAMDLRSYVSGVEADRYRFTGHEHDGESGYDYHGARYYQAEVGRYLGVDVMAGKYAALSSYCYVAGNPVMLVDPGGESLRFADKEFATWFNESYYPSMSESDRSRIDALRNSAVIYDIGYAKLEGRLGATEYDFEGSAKEGADVVRVQIDKGQFKLGGHQYATTVLGDELQHAYQFETGKIGFAHLRNQGVNSYTSIGYDLDDELESQVGSVNSLYGYLQGQGANLDDAASRSKTLMAAFPNNAKDRSLNNAIGYRTEVLLGTKSGKEYIYEKAGYSDGNFWGGNAMPGVQTPILGNPTFSIGAELEREGEKWRINEIKARPQK